MFTFDTLLKIFLVVFGSFTALFVIQACCSLFNIEEDLRKMRIKAMIDLDEIKPIGDRYKVALIGSFIVVVFTLVFGFFFCGGIS